MKMGFDLLHAQPVIGSEWEVAHSLIIFGNMFEHGV